MGRRTAGARPGRRSARARAARGGRPGGSAWPPAPRGSASTAPSPRRTRGRAVRAGGGPAPSPAACAAGPPCRRPGGAGRRAARRARRSPRPPRRGRARRSGRRSADAARSGPRPGRRRPRGRGARSRARRPTRPRPRRRCDRPATGAGTRRRRAAGAARPRGPVAPGPPRSHRSSPLRTRAGTVDPGADEIRSLPPVSRLRGGIDIGGTKVQAIVVDERHQVRGQARHPTPQDGGPDSILDALAAAQPDAAPHAEIDPPLLAGVGVGAPGDVDDAAGTIANAANLTGFDGPVPVADALRKALGVSEGRLANDVSVATGAEFELGAARPYSSVLGVFWGTGVGGGVILDGREWHGRGGAGEIGHMVVRKGGADCPCGRKGCMEAYAGRRAMEAEARRRHDKGEKTILFKLMKERGRDRLTAGLWLRAHEQGDKLTQEILDRAYGALGAGVASAVNLLDVEAVVLGGGVGTKFGAPARDRLAAEMAPHLFNDDRPPEILLAELGDLGGALGAALLVGRG